MDLAWRKQEQSVFSEPKIYLSFGIGMAGNIATPTPMHEKTVFQSPLGEPNIACTIIAILQRQQKYLTAKKLRIVKSRPIPLSATPAGAPSAVNHTLIWARILLSFGCLTPSGRP
jgi:hypothetical protein